jgi:hypothetical protein
MTYLLLVLVGGLRGCFAFRWHCKKEEGVTELEFGVENEHYLNIV